MPPDLAFAFFLLIKMAVTAAFVLVATITAERAGPLVGGLVATLPIGAGPVYVFLALDHDAHFIAQSATASLAINAVNVTFALIYAMLAQRRSLAISISAAFVVWLGFALLVNSFAWNFAAAALVNIVFLSVALWLAAPLRHVKMPRYHARWYELALRALAVAMLVGVVVTFSFQLGANGSGILAVFPIVLMSIMVILHRRVGGKPTAAVLATAVLGLVGFGFCCAALHFTAEPFGKWVGLSIALAISVGWSVLVMALRRYGIQL
jgi:hypothetical protein